MSEERGGAPAGEPRKAGDGSFQATLERLAPKGSRARAALAVSRKTLRDARAFGGRTRWQWHHARAAGAAEPAYSEWLDRHRLTPDELAQQRGRVKDAAMTVKVDCVVLEDGDRAGLAETLRSLKRQTFRDWTARVVGSGSLASISDRRISRAGGDEAEVLAQLLSTGDERGFVMVLRAGDVLEPDLLFNVAAHGWDDPSAELVHWDDDRIGPNGEAGDPRFQPAWSPDTLLSANYLGRSFAVRRNRAAAAGGFGQRRGDGRWWDLLLRLGLDERQVVRVPRVLLHLSRRPEVAPAEGAEIVQGHLDSTGRRGRVEQQGQALRVAWDLGEKPGVSIVIPTKSRETLLAACLDAIARTDYPSFEVVVVDSGGRSDAAERWYAKRSVDLDLKTIWWEGPFNYSAANNLGAREATGDLLVFLNDDTEPRDPGWLAELAGWASQPGIGLAGLQLVDGKGAIQHGGVVVGLNGFADHLFAGVAPGSDTLLGSTDWYRNCISLTAACVAVERATFEKIGGFDEKFLLCGSDVVLGLDSRFRGLRNVCSPFGGVRHLEAETRGKDVPLDDVFSSYWRYQRWLNSEDPYFSPNLSLHSTVPRLRGEDEPPSMAIVGRIMGREFSVFRQTSTEKESRFLVSSCHADRALEERMRAENQSADAGPVRTINWFIPDIDSPFYGGINTALRMADYLTREHKVENQFVALAAPNEPYIRSALRAAFPSLAESRIAFSDGDSGAALDALPPADVSIATQWHTAYVTANFPQTGKRFYLIQDFEPLFYPAGTNYALAEETYRLGLHGICNTERMLSLYRNRYGGEGTAFMPAVDPTVFHAGDRPEREGPVTVFTYARPGHWRNCWELASAALGQLKQILGQEIRIVTAGSWARPDDLGRGIEHLGLLDYRETGELYRRCDIGLALTVSEHPSYLPLELLACGTPVVAFDNRAGDWILRHEENSLLCPRTADGLIEGLERMATDAALRKRLASRGLTDIATHHSDWDASFAGIYRYLSNPAARPSPEPITASQ